MSLDLISPFLRFCCALRQLESRFRFFNDINWNIIIHHGYVPLLVLMEWNKWPAVICWFLFGPEHVLWNIVLYCWFTLELTEDHSCSGWRPCCKILKLMNQFDQWPRVKSTGRLKCCQLAWNNSTQAVLLFQTAYINNKGLCKTVNVAIA